MERLTSNMALYVDFENFVTRDFTSDDFEIGEIVSKLKERGRLIVKKAYADWGRFYRAKQDFLKNSVELIEMPSHGPRRKNSSDIKLAVEALEDALHKPHIDVFVIVSGDSDFTPLIAKLREYDKHVIVIADRKNVSELIKGYCDELIYYSTLVGTPELDPEELEKSWVLLDRALTGLEQEGRPPVASAVKMMIRRIDPSFDEENFEFRQFKEFLTHWEKQRKIQLTHGPNGEIFVSKMAVPPPAFSAVATPAAQPPGAAFEARILARMRQYGMQFIDAPTRAAIMAALFKLISEIGRANRRTISDRLMNDFNAHIEARQLSKTKIGGVVNVVMSAGAFDMDRSNEDTVYTLRSDIASAQHLIDLHDGCIYYIAQNNGVSPSVIDGLVQRQPDERAGAESWFGFIETNGRIASWIAQGEDTE